MESIARLLENLDADPNRRGKQFEHICKWFLTNDPVYRQQLRRVWLWDEWPGGRWGADAGIDLVAEDHQGHLWAVQAKAYDPKYSVTKADVDSFLSESNRRQFSYRLLVATTDRIGATARRTLDGQEKPVGFVGLAGLEASGIDWPTHVAHLRPRRFRAKKPRPHQRQAVAEVLKGFKSGDRGQLTMACGTGKTLAALFLTERLEAVRTLVLVPSLSLLSQTLREWLSNTSSGFVPLAVCSDETVADHDAVVATTTELAMPVTTDPAEIATFLRGRGRRVLFATYQSSPRIAEAYGLGRVPGLDLVVADEAHRCAGRVSSDFATVLDDDAIPARRRLFMTATPRYFTGQVVREARDADFEVASMDNESVFGPVFHRLTFGEAISRDLLSDYQVAVVGVDDATYRDWAERGRLVSLDGIAVMDARSLAGQIGLAKAIRKYGLHRSITFHSRVVAARRFANALPAVIAWMPAGQRPHDVVWADLVSGEMSAGERNVQLGRIRNLEPGTAGVLTNARCLSEGVDVPTLDGVAFIDPRRSEVDIVQAVGRAIRKADDKAVGTIVIPVYIGSDDDPEIALDDSAFRPVWDVLKALRAHDDDLAEQLDSLRRDLGRRAAGVVLPSKIHFDLPTGVSADFASAFDIRLVEQTTNKWHFSLGLLQRYIDREGTANVPQSWLENGHRLGQWVAAIRVRYAAGRFTDPVRIQELEHLQGWSWTPRDDRWEEGFSYLLQFAQREGHALIPVDHVEDGYRLGRWVRKQRNLLRKSPNEEHYRRLDGVPGWTWEPYDAQWEHAFGLLQAFADREGHGAVPQSFIEDGVRLGTWVSNQRSDHRTGRLPQEREQRLEGVSGWLWNPIDERWEQGYRLLQHFVERNGDSRVPVDYRTEEYPLGQWVRVQRVFYSKGKLASDRVARLENLPGWRWDPFADQWEEGFAALLSYVAREGTARVHRGHIEGTYRLGDWTQNQRAFYRRGKLSADRIARLEVLPDWQWVLPKGPRPRSN